jgi:hypothetical protein
LCGGAVYVPGISIATGIASLSTNPNLLHWVHRLPNKNFPHVIFFACGIVVLAQCLLRTYCAEGNRFGKGFGKLICAPFPKRIAPNELPLGLTDPAPALPGANTSAKTCRNHSGPGPRPIIPSPKHQYYTGTMDGSAERSLLLEFAKNVNWNSCQSSRWWRKKTL